MKLNKLLICIAITAVISILISLIACGNNSPEPATIEPATIIEQMPLVLEPAPEPEPIYAVLDLGGIRATNEKLLELFALQVEQNQEKLKIWQEETAIEAGYTPTEFRTATGALIYLFESENDDEAVEDEATEDEEVEEYVESLVAFFSGRELVEVRGVNIFSAGCPLYDLEQMATALGRSPESFMTEDGVMIQDTGARWTTNFDATAEIGMVMVNGYPIMQGNAGTGEYLLMSAFMDGANTLAEVRENAGYGSSYAEVNGTRYEILESKGPLSIGINTAGDKMVLTVDQMVLPQGDDGRVDTKEWANWLTSEFGGMLRDETGASGFKYLEMEIGQSEWVWSPGAGLEEVKPITLRDSAGSLQISVESLKSALGVEVYFDGAGAMNIVTDPVYNELASGSELGWVTTGSSWQEQEKVQSHKVVVEQLRVQEENAAAQQKAAQQEAIRIQEEAAKRAEQQRQAEIAQQQSGSSSSQSGGSQSSGGGSQQQSGSFKEPSNKPSCFDQISNARWDSAYGVWRGTLNSGDAGWLHPNGAMGEGPPPAWVKNW